MIALDRLSLAIHGTPILRGVSLDIAPGEIFGLVGESGCGKTTTCRTILRALDPTSGEVLFKTNGSYTDLAKLKPKQLRSLRQKMQMI